MAQRRCSTIRISYLENQGLFKLAEIREVAKIKFTHELHDKLNKLEREIIKELTKRE
ncbi:conjugal transfer nickase/helicase TraI [Aeromonas salmonicida]|nr:conjugal transfer nickase/helicase TraI [Aeromonas salmonicida]SUW45083.1 conjugal transfer nickase/helicase TraI [Aeromonas salmonicida]